MKKLVCILTLIGLSAVFVSCEEENEIVPLEQEQKTVQAKTESIITSDKENDPDPNEEEDIDIIM